MATIWEVMADPSRRAMLQLLLERPRPVGEIVVALGMSQPATSKHLRVLRDAGLVMPTVDRQRRIYELTPGPLAEMADYLAPYRHLFKASLDKLGRHLDDLHGSGDGRHLDDRYGSADEHPPGGRALPINAPELEER